MNKTRKLFWTFRLYPFWKQKSFQSASGDHRRCFIFLAADYGNLGDVAITYAQKKFLQENFPGYEVIEVPAACTLKYINSIKKQIKPDDIVTIVGGGNMGDMYGDIELLRLMVVKKFRNNRIILFPQTIDYSASKEALWLMRLSQKIYNRAESLTMCAREKVSYDTMRRLYPDIEVKLTPDIVMGLNERSHEERRNVVTYCIRNDKEKADNDRILEHLTTECENLNLTIEYYDTHIGENRYSEKEKYRELSKIWSQFRRSKLIVTDRLHGMIFSYITGTPAIVLPNSNFKIEGCYQWIKDCGYIYYCDNPNDVVDISKIILAGHNTNVGERISEQLKAIL